MYFETGGGRENKGGSCESVKEEFCLLWGEEVKGPLKQGLFSGGMWGCGSTLEGTVVVKGGSKGMGSPEKVCVWGDNSRWLRRGALS